MRAQFAKFTVRTSQTERRTQWKSDTSANRLECAVATGSELVVTGDERSAGRSDALIKESQLCINPVRR